MSGLKIFVLIMIILSVAFLFSNQILNMITMITTSFSDKSQAISSSLRSKPYVEAFSLNDESIRADAVQIIRDCPKRDESCFINSIYEYVVNNYKYIPDPTRREFIQPYTYTKSIGGGDCEDLTVVLASLLENIGVKTYFVLTDTHGYLLACTRELDQGILGEKNSINLVKISLAKNSSKFVPFDYEGGEKNLKLDYHLTSNRLVSVFVVPSLEDFELFKSEKEFNQYLDCTLKRDSDKKKKCAVTDVAGFIVQNEYNGETNAFLTAKIYSSHKGNVRYYNVGNMQCIVLDGTAGPNGYPGFEENLKGMKIAVDPKTEKTLILP